MAKGKQRYNYLVGPKFEKKFKMGNNFFLEITKEGFCLWDIKNRRWVLDASTFVEEGQITLCYRMFKQTLNKWHKKRIFTWRWKWIN